MLSFGQYLLTEAEYTDVRVGGDSYAKRDELKRMGAKFDSTSKAWFVPLAKAKAVAALGLTPLYHVGGKTFAAKEVIKRNGGVWDLGRKAWYAPESSADALNHAGLTLHLYGLSDHEKKQQKTAGAFEDFEEVFWPHARDNYVTNDFQFRWMSKFKLVRDGSRIIGPAKDVPKAQKAIMDFTKAQAELHDEMKKMKKGKRVKGTYIGVPLTGTIMGVEFPFERNFQGGKVEVALDEPITVFGLERTTVRVDLSVGGEVALLPGERNPDTLEVI